MVGFSNKIIYVSILGNNQQCHTQRHPNSNQGTNSIQLVLLQCKAIVSNSNLVMFYKVTHHSIVQPKALGMLKHCLCHLIQLSNLLQTMSSYKWCYVTPKVNLIYFNKFTVKVTCNMNDCSAIKSNGVPNSTKS